MLRGLALIGLVSFTLVGTASAQDHASGNDADARALFTAASHEFDAGRYEQALALFDQSYTMSTRPALLYNIGLCHDRLGHDREALDAFRRFLDGDPTTTHRTEVEVRIRALQDAVARQEAAASATTTATTTTTTAPTPADTAHADAAAHTETQQGPPPPPPHHGGSVLEEWWFWTIVGVVVVGGVVGGLVIADATRGTEAPITPANGVFTALVEVR